MWIIEIMNAFASQKQLFVCLQSGKHTKELPYINYQWLQVRFCFYFAFLESKDFIILCYYKAM